MLLIGGGSYMLGYGAPETEACDAAGAFDCTMPPIPSGAGPATRTRILGAGWETGCADPPELWGAERPWFILNLTDASHVELGCLEMTDHSDCVEFHLHGLGGSALTCERDSCAVRPLGIGGRLCRGCCGRLSARSEYPWPGFNGHSRRAVDGLVGSRMCASPATAGSAGMVTLTGMMAMGARWHFAAGRWSGTAAVRPIPAGSPPAVGRRPPGVTAMASAPARPAAIGSSRIPRFLHNTSDGLDLLYVRRPGSQIELRRVHAEGNAGNQIKTNGPVTVENSVIVGNCGYFDGQPFTYNVDSCRAAGNAASLTLRPSNRVDPDQQHADQ